MLTLQGLCQPGFTNRTRAGSARSRERTPHPVPAILTIHCRMNDRSASVRSQRVHAGRSGSFGEHTLAVACCHWRNSVSPIA